MPPKRTSNNKEDEKTSPLGGPLQQPLPPFDPVHIDDDSEDQVVDTTNDSVDDKMDDSENPKMDDSDDPKMDDSERTSEIGKDSIQASVGVPRTSVAEEYESTDDRDHQSREGNTDEDLEQVTSVEDSGTSKEESRVPLFPDGRSLIDFVVDSNIHLLRTDPPPAAGSGVSPSTSAQDTRSGGFVILPSTSQVTGSDIFVSRSTSSLSQVPGSATQERQLTGTTGTSAEEAQPPNASEGEFGLVSATFKALVEAACVAANVSEGDSNQPTGGNELVGPNPPAGGNELVGLNPPARGNELVDPNPPTGRNELVDPNPPSEENVPVFPNVKNGTHGLNGTNDTTRRWVIYDHPANNNGYKIVVFSDISSEEESEQPEVPVGPPLPGDIESPKDDGPNGCLQEKEEHSTGNVTDQLPLLGVPHNPLAIALPQPQNSDSDSSQLSDEDCSSVEYALLEPDDEMKIELSEEELDSKSVAMEDTKEENVKEENKLLTKDGFPVPESSDSISKGLKSPEPDSSDLKNEELKSSELKVSCYKSEASKSPDSVSSDSESKEFKSSEESDLKRDGLKSPKPEDSDSKRDGSKSPEPEDSDSKSDGSKSPEPEDSDSKRDGSKSPEPEDSDSKSDGSKSPEPEDSDTKSDGSKSPEPEDSDSKSDGSKSPEPEDSDSKSDGSKSPEPESSDSKSDARDIPEPKSIPDPTSPVAHVDSEEPEADEGPQVPESIPDPTAPVAMTDPKEPGAVAGPPAPEATPEPTAPVANVDTEESEAVAGPQVPESIPDPTAPVAHVDPEEPEGLVGPKEPEVSPDPITPVAHVDPEEPEGLMGPLASEAIPDPIAPVARVDPEEPKAVVGPKDPEVIPDPIAPVAHVDPEEPEGLVGPLAPGAIPEPTAPVAHVDPEEAEAVAGPKEPEVIPNPIAPVAHVDPEEAEAVASPLAPEAVAGLLAPEAVGGPQDEAVEYLMDLDAILGPNEHGAIERDLELAYMNAQFLLMAADRMRNVILQGPARVHINYQPGPGPVVLEEPREREYVPPPQDSDESSAEEGGEMQSPQRMASPQLEPIDWEEVRMYIDFEDNHRRGDEQFVDAEPYDPANIRNVLVPMAAPDNRGILVPYVHPKRRRIFVHLDSITLRHYQFVTSNVEMCERYSLIENLTNGWASRTVDFGAPFRNFLDLCTATCFRIRQRNARDPRLSDAGVRFHQIAGVLTDCDLIIQRNRYILDYVASYSDWIKGMYQDYVFTGRNIEANDIFPERFLELNEYLDRAQANMFLYPTYVEAFNEFRAMLEALLFGNE